MSRDYTGRYTHTVDSKTWRLYGCAKRGCDKINLDFESFGTSSGKGYCLDHIPWRIRFRMLTQNF